MATLKDYLISGKFNGEVSINGMKMTLKDMLISAKLSGGGTPPTPEPIIVPVTIETAGAKTRMWTQVIDARDNDVHVVIPFIEGSPYLNADAAAETTIFGLAASLYSDADGTVDAGAYYSGAVQSSAWTSTRNDLTPCNTEWVVPKGYYVRIVLFKRNSPTPSNGAFQDYARSALTSVTLV